MLIFSCIYILGFLISDRYLPEAYPFDIISVQLKVMEQKNMKLCDSTLASLSMICSRSLELDLAEGFLHQISTSQSPFPYNAFLEACDAMVSNS